MELKIVDFETAKLLKEKGFDWDVVNFYTKGGTLENLIPEYPYTELSIDYDNLGISIDKTGEYNWNSCVDFILISAFNESIGVRYEMGYSAPTQALVVKWLRDVHKIHIVIDLHWIARGYDYSIYKIDNDMETVVSKQVVYEDIRTYEEAELTGIIEALKLI